MKIPVEKALRKVSEHVGVVKGELNRSFPGKRLHEIPFRDVVLGASEALCKHPDFKETPSAGTPSKKRISPVNLGNKPLYLSYELGFHIIKERVISQLKAENTFPPECEELLSIALGRIYGFPPKRLLKERINAIDELQEKLGAKKTREIFNRALEVWASHGEECLTKEDYKKHYLNDTFSNPAWFYGLKIAAKDPGINAKNITEKYRQHLTRLMNSNTESYYQ